MSQSTDPRHFFESDAAQATRERRAAKSSNKYGRPIALKSKALAAIPAPNAPSPAIFVAESAGTVRLVRFDSEDTKTVYRGPSAPVTSIALGGPGQSTLFAGSWDKSVWSWDVETRKQGRKFSGHSDFVKTVVCALLGSGKDLLISGGADRKIIVWDAVSGQKLHVLQDSVQNMLAVLHLAVDPAERTADAITIVSASSDPHIRRWRLTVDHWEQLVDHGGGRNSNNGVDKATGDEGRTIQAHETSVYRLAFNQDEDDVDLWTASGDGTAKCLSRAGGFASDELLEHGDHVKAIAVTDDWVVTAGRDEDLKFWDRLSGKLYCAVEGHYDEVTDLVVLQEKQPAQLCSVSLDGTVRIWPLQRALLDVLIAEQKSASIGRIKPPEEETGETPILTAEEEAELAALMADDD